MRLPSAPAREVTCPWERCPWERGRPARTGPQARRNSATKRHAPTPEPRAQDVAQPRLPPPSRPARRRTVHHLPSGRRGPRRSRGGVESRVAALRSGRRRRSPQRGAAQANRTLRRSGTWCVLVARRSNRRDRAGRIAALRWRAVPSAGSRSSELPFRSGGRMRGCVERCPCSVADPLLCAPMTRNEGAIRASAVALIQAGGSTRTPSGRVNRSGGCVQPTTSGSRTLERPSSFTFWRCPSRCGAATAARPPVVPSPEPGCGMDFRLTHDEVCAWSRILDHTVRK